MVNLQKHYQESIGAKIRREREKLGISQEQFGALVKAHRTYVGMIERGEKNITLHNLIKFAQALNMQIRDLIDF